MNKREKLLTAALGDGEGAAFAAQAAALTRRRRALKQAGVAGGLMMAGIAAIFSTNRPAPLVATPPVPEAPTVEIMSDRELIAQLTGQPVLFIKKDHKITGVVFLDAGRKL